MIVCLCGSTRFKEDYQKANLAWTLAGQIVLTIGCDVKTDVELELQEETKLMLDALHMCKIDLCDIVYVVGDGYVGDSTKREIQYAKLKRKEITYQIDVPLDKIKEYYAIYTY